MTRRPYACGVPGKSKYQRIADDLRARISSGEYPPGSQLPTKADLMARYQVAVNTVERAIDELRKAGLVETLQGAGMFVCEPPAPDTGPSPEYTALMERLDGTDDLVRRLADRVDELEKLIRAGRP
jgi:DNA-binding GntR family transcriptional regulator